MKVLILMLALLLTGCNLLDATARHGVGQNAVLKLTSQHVLSKTELADGEWRSFSFCQEWQLPASIPLQVHFACELTPAEITRYQTVLSQYHPALMAKLQRSLLADVLPLQTPPCLYIVPDKTKVRRYQLADPCMAIYIQSKAHSLSDQEAPFDDDTLLVYLGMDFYAAWLHEAFHAETVPAWHQPQTGRFANRWINEYLAYLIDDFTGFSALTLVNQNPHNRQILTEQDALWNTIRQPNCNWADQVASAWSVPSTDISLTGFAFRESLLESLHTHPSMLPFYYALEIQALTDPAADFQTLKSRIPRCQGNKVGEVFALKHRLLDYDLTVLATDTAAPVVGLSSMVQQALRQSFTPKDPFAHCKNAVFHPRVVEACSALMLDYLTLHQYQLALQINPVNISLPPEAMVLQPRLALLLDDLQLLKTQLTIVKEHTLPNTALASNALPSTVLQSNINDYTLATDGRFRNVAGQVADTGSTFNVWPAQQATCQLQGKQQVRTLGNALKTLERCQLDPLKGVIWQTAQQQDQVVGLPLLLSQQARLIKEPQAMRVAEKVPYLFQDGWLVFQQQDNGVRLNLCLDSGSLRSYLTPRYKERYQLTDPELASAIEPEQPVYNERQIRWPLLGETRLLKVLPNPEFLQCDVIVGSDLLGIFSAIEIHQTQLTLWRSIKPTEQSNK